MNILMFCAICAVLITRRTNKRKYGEKRVGDFHLLFPIVHKVTKKYKK